MSLVHLVIALALMEFFAFSWAVGRARVRYNVPAPATTGNASFECYFRVQMNTLEQLVIFVPSMVMFAHYWGPTVAAAHPQQAQDLIDLLTGAGQQEQRQRAGFISGRSQAPK